jgi:hypothetical protein
MRKIIFLVLLIPFIDAAQGQRGNNLDSLKNLLTRETTDTGRIILSYRIAYELQYSDLEQSLPLKLLMSQRN